MAAFRCMAELTGDEWADGNPSDIDKRAAVVQGEELPQQERIFSVGCSDDDHKWLLGQLEL